MTLRQNLQARLSGSNVTNGKYFVERHRMLYKCATSENLNNSATHFGMQNALDKIAIRPEKDQYTADIEKAVKI